MLRWVFVSMRRLSPVVASGGHSSSRCAGLSLSRPFLLRSTGSRRAGSVGVAHGPSCSAACGILPDQGTNPCPLHWQADSQPLRHQGSPLLFIFMRPRCQRDNGWWYFVPSECFLSGTVAAVQDYCLGHNSCPQCTTGKGEAAKQNPRRVMAPLSEHNCQPGRWLQPFVYFPSK